MTTMILQCTFLPALICTYSNILKEYKLAQFHCYGRYLAKHVQRNLTLSETAELDVDKFYKMHLPNGLDNLASATMVVSETLVYLYNPNSDKVFHLSYTCIKPERHHGLQNSTSVIQNFLAEFQQPEQLFYSGR